MITLTKSAHQAQTCKTASAKPQTDAVETAGSLAMLFENGLMTMGQYDEFINSNPFTVDYSQYANCDGDAVACNSFMGEFASAMATFGDCGGLSAGFSDGGFSGSSCGCSCGGGFSSVC